MKKKISLILLSSALVMSVSAQSYLPAPSLYTKAHNDSIAQIVESFGSEDFVNANKGFIGGYDKEGKIVKANKLPEEKDWNYWKTKIPENINPSLWHYIHVNGPAGLFEVLPNQIYQVRGLDIGSVTFVKTNTGYVVIDVTTNEEAAAAAYQLFTHFVGKHPVKAVIYTHSHGDHYAGIQGILKSQPDSGAGIPIIAPSKFFESAIDENVIAGVPMGRRATYQFGTFLKDDTDGYSFTSRHGDLIPATQELTEDEQTVKIDGVDFDFLQTPNTEAVSATIVYIPKYKALCQADEVIHTMHNLLTPRGAKIRDGLAWSKYLDRALAKWGKEVQVSFGQHQWPVWGNDKVNELWEKQRDLYRYTHDQTLYFANQGYTPSEIANTIKLPKSLQDYTANREYYGKLSFNARSQYQLYFGFFDGVPANIDPLTPTEEGKEWVEAIGGVEQALTVAQKAYDNGKYRWAATLLNKIVFAYPNHSGARKLLADSYAQLGYQEESQIFRYYYLAGAKELLKGVKKKETKNLLSPKVGIGLLFDVVGSRFNGAKIDKSLTINVKTIDTGEVATVILKNNALSNRPNVLSDQPDIVLSASKKDIVDLFSRNTELNDRFTIFGNQSDLQSILDLIETPDYYFNIIEP